MPGGESEVRVVDCGYCGGSRVAGTGSCPACRGSGRHRVTLQGGARLVKCRPCGGGGATGVGLCSRCNGSGWDVV